MECDVKVGCVEQADNMTQILNFKLTNDIENYNGKSCLVLVQLK